MRGLNIGCGRATFPTTKDNPFTAHLLYAIKAGCPAALDSGAEWVNIDRVAGPGIQEVVNVFRYPFLRASDGKPFDDNSFDVIWMSHIIEHIPHAIRLSDYAGGGGGIETHRKMEANDGDGWFSFFFECWRILKPNGRMAVLFPYGPSVAGMSDPTHTRYILPASFSYFQPNPEAPFNYDLPLRFRQVTESEDVSLPPSGLLKIINETFEIRQKIDELEEQYQSVAPDDPRRKSAREFLDDQHALAEKYMYRHFNQVEDSFFVFEAVKG